MEKIAAGRVAFWEGGSLWVFDVPGVLGTPNRNAMHAHHAFQLTFSLGGEFKLHLDDRIVPGPAAVVAPDTTHAFEARGLVALLFVEPESRAGRSLGKLIAGQSAAATCQIVELSKSNGLGNFQIVANEDAGFAARR